MATRREFIEAHQTSTSHEEVAEKTGLTVGTCRSYMSKLRGLGFDMISFKRPSQETLKEDIAFAKSLLADEDTSEEGDTPKEGESNPVVDTVVVETPTIEETVETPTNG